MTIEKAWCNDCGTGIKDEAVVLYNVATPFHRRGRCPETGWRIPTWDLRCVPCAKWLDGTPNALVGHTYKVWKDLKNIYTLPTDNNTTQESQ